DGSHPETILNIKVNPPFTLPWIAFVFYFIVLGSIIYGLYHVLHMRASLRIEIKQREQTEELNRSRMFFFSNISHEFKTPLTIIVSQLETLLQLKDIPLQAFKKLKGILRNASQMNKLISELLDFSKQEAEPSKICPQVPDITNLVEEVYLSFVDYAQTRGILLKLEQHDTPVEFLFDSNKIEKVVVNLLSNAFKFTPDEGTITVKTCVNKDNFKINVIDNGQGIEKKDIAYIFDRYYQSSAAKYSGPSGT